MAHFTVKRIFNRVDQVFKERKDECLKIVFEIADLENQLDCLQKNTRDYSEASATQGANLSWTEANVEKLQGELDELQVKYVEPTLREYAIAVEQEKEGKHTALCVDLFLTVSCS